jgi:hypothetical protein
MNLLLSGENAAISSVNSDEQEFISVANEANSDDLLLPTLLMMGFTADALDLNKKSDIYSALEHINVKIIAQSSVGDVLHTLLEVSSPQETKRIVITEGTMVSDYVVKSIDSKQLILEKNNEEYTIKLFHPKELNQNRIENDPK